MVNPLRLPLVLLGILVGMVLFVHTHRPRPVETPETGKDALRLRKASDLFLTSNVRERSGEGAQVASPTPASETDRATDVVERAPSAVIAPQSGFLKPMPASGQLPSVLAPAGAVTGQLSPLPSAVSSSHVTRAAATSQGSGLSGDAPRYLPAGPGKRAAVMHRIVDGDTLRDLAARYLGNESRYLEIFEANREVLVRPDLLPLGVKIRIPMQRP